MTVNILFNKANKLFINKNYFEGLKIYEHIWLKYPKNTRLYEEINKKLKKYKKSILQTYTQTEIQNFFRLEKSGQVSIVIQNLSDNLKKNPSDILTISLLGSFYNSVKNYDKALAFQKLAIQKSPLEGAFYLNFYETLQNKNKLQDALKSLHIAKILSLKDKTIDYKIAKLQTKMKNFARADLIYKDLLREKNTNKKILYSYCDNLIKFKKEQEAIQFIDNYEKTQKNDDKIKLLLGLAYFNQNNINKAKKNFLLAIDMNPQNTDALNMMGNSYERLGNIKKAEQFYHDALKINTNDKMTLNNLAALSFYQGELKTAEKLYSEASTKIENNYEAMHALGLCQLAQLKFNEGWKNFQFRWFVNRFNSVNLASNLPKFNINIDNQYLLVWDEQGLGDKILFLRFLRYLEPYVDDLFIKIDKRLHEIIKRDYPKINLIYNNKNILESSINSQIAICDLGSVFINESSDLKNFSKTYISSDSILTKKLKKHLKNKNKLICGLSWVSKSDDIGVSKSISLELLKPILDLDNIIFLDLQYSDTEDERNSFFNENGIEIKKYNNIDNFNDLNSVTSLIDACDFIVTVSNTTAHIAGALGKKTFLLLPKGKGRLWYWSSLKNKSIWYPSIEIIEQNLPGEWEPVIDNLRKKVESYKNG